MVIPIVDSTNLNTFKILGFKNLFFEKMVIGYSITSYNDDNTIYRGKNQLTLHVFLILSIPPGIYGFWVFTRVNS